jgi:hypothetical protein
VIGWIALSGCSSGAEPISATTLVVEPGSPTATVAEPIAAGVVFPAAAEGEFDLDQLEPFTGVLRLSELGCWTIEWSRGVSTAIFAPGFSASGEDQLVSSTGSLLGDGDRVAGTAALIDALVLLPGGRTGRWADYVAFCASSKGALVIGELSPA